MIGIEAVLESERVPDLMQHRHEAVGAGGLVVVVGPVVVEPDVALLLKARLGEEGEVRARLDLRIEERGAEGGVAGVAPVDDPAGRYIAELLGCPALAKQMVIAPSADSARLLASRCNFR